MATDLYILARSYSAGTTVARRCGRPKGSLFRLRSRKVVPVSSSIRAAVDKTYVFERAGLAAPGVDSVLSILNREITE